MDTGGSRPTATRPAHLQRHISRRGAGTARATSCRLEALGPVAQATPTATLDTCTKSAGRTDEKDIVEEEDTDTVEEEEEDTGEEEDTDTVTGMYAFIFICFLYAHT